MDPAITVPTPEDLMWPALRSLRLLGNSASHQELLDKVIEMEKLPEAVQNQMHVASAGWTRLSYNLGVAKLALGRMGLIEAGPKAKGFWIATEQGKTVDSLAKPKPAAKPLPPESEEQPAWKSDLLSLLGNIPPDAFERLSQRILRAAGFTKVQVTGQSGDGGIDGFGTLRISHLLSFHVLFQCKRYKDRVSSPDVRNFRGAMSGRTDKGLLITTGTFTADAIKEATRDGVPPIDLIDGDRLCDLLKDLQLGVETQLVERVTLNPSFFTAI